MVAPYLAKDQFNHAIQCLSPGTTQTVAISTSSAATTNILARSTIVIRVVSSTNCFIAIGTGTPTATTAGTPIFAGIPEYFRVNGNEGIRIAGIQITASGSLYVTEML